MCTPRQLECVGAVGAARDCLENCQGIIMDVETLSSSRDEAGMAQFFADYERFKSPDSSNITFPNVMKGKQPAFFPL